MEGDASREEVMLEVTEDVLLFVKTHKEVMLEV